MKAGRLVLAGLLAAGLATAAFSADSEEMERTIRQLQEDLARVEEDLAELRSQYPKR